MGKEKLGLVLILTFGISVFLIRLYISRYTLEEGNSVRVLGNVSEDVVTVSGRQKITVDRFTLYAPAYPEFSYGDRVEVVGLVEKNKHGFDRWILDQGKIALVQESNLLLKLRSRLVFLYRRVLPEPHASLVAGVVLGTKSSLDSSFFESLRTTSTLHIIVASGTNISLVAGSLMPIFVAFLSRRRAVWVVVFVIWVYVFLSGWQPPIVRAGVMGTVAFLAQAWGREFNGLRALVLTGWLLLIFNPFWLFDLGFQLSFLATLGVLILAPFFERRFSRVPSFLRGDMSTTLAAQIAVSPVLYLSFGQIFYLGPIVNLLVLWTVPFIMLGGVLVAFFGLLWEPLGRVWAWIVWLPLEYFVRIVGLFGNF